MCLSFETIYQLRAGLPPQDGVLYLTIGYDDLNQQIYAAGIMAGQVFVADTSSCADLPYNALKDETSPEDLICILGCLFDTLPAKPCCIVLTQLCAWDSAWNAGSFSLPPEISGKYLPGEEARIFETLVLVSQIHYPKIPVFVEELVIQENCLDRSEIKDDLATEVFRRRRVDLCVCKIPEYSCDVLSKVARGEELIKCPNFCDAERANYPLDFGETDFDVTKIPEGFMYLFIGHDSSEPEVYAELRFKDQIIASSQTATDENKLLGPAACALLEVLEKLEEDTDLAEDFFDKTKCIVLAHGRDVTPKTTDATGIEVIDPSASGTSFTSKYPAQLQAQMFDLMVFMLREYFAIQKAGDINIYADYNLIFNNQNIAPENVLLNLSKEIIRSRIVNLSIEDDTTKELIGSYYGDITCDITMANHIICSSFYKHRVEQRKVEAAKPIVQAPQSPACPSIINGPFFLYPFSTNPLSI